MDDLISELLKAGLSIDDLKHLERLSDPTILGHVPSGKKYLRHNHKADVVEYLAAWAGMLENEMAETIRLKEIMDLEETVHV